MAENIVTQAADAQVMYALFEATWGERFNKKLSASTEHASRLANLSIVLRLIKTQLKPYVKVTSPSPLPALYGADPRQLISYLTHLRPYFSTA